MLKYNLQKMYTARGITNRIGFLQKCGFSQGVVYRLTNNQFRQLTLKQLEIFCLNLNCTPNDLLEWTPEKPELLNQDVPLRKLLSPANQTNILSVVNDVPFDKLDLLVKKIEEIKKTL